MFDEEGGIQGLMQSDPSAAVYVKPIPIEKALLFRVKQYKNNPEGRSLLRNAYRPWYYKHRIEEIEAVGIERDLAGLPIAYIPPEYLSSGASADQVAFRNAIEQIVQNVKRNEQEGIVMPLMYDESGHKMFELNLLTSGGSRQFDTDKIIQRYDQRIAMSVLSDFILLGHDRVGSFSLGTAKMDLWSMAVDAIANSIAEVINQYAIPRLLKLNNMDLERPPYLTYGEVSHIDLTEIADYVSKLANSGMIISDPNLEDYLRDLAGLPPADHNNAAAMGVAPQDEAFLTADEQALIDGMESPETPQEEEMTGSPTEAVE
jgi:phage gp29-like protein